VCLVHVTAMMKEAVVCLVHVTAMVKDAVVCLERMVGLGRGQGAPERRGMLGDDGRRGRSA
jgi:hypothetical protein